ncbi:GNAT family N-acetyltransferase [Gelidibacter japonicus]|jgi:diamine N-acetyltransferase|uniref:GNAT family N-acetyltransferase n=1 Tax=Gelidibacter japonicus TaxID=1962232 RepID=UPI0013D5D33E|nr:GNAT family protein [Gelidibacter japonicus]MCL8007482.1 GNAT family N-acetyltransferase [Gelidibacter japonicus]
MKETLKGKHIYLRALEPEDLSFLSAIENDETLWELSHTQTPYSQYILKQYLANSHLDIYEAKQLRLVISNYAGQPLGMIDLFDFDFKNRRAGIGILIQHFGDRQKGYGKEALQLLIDYSFKHLDLHQLYCNILEDNKASIKLFVNQGFEIVGLKKDWVYSNKTYKNEYLLQLINS